MYFLHKHNLYSHNLVYGLRLILTPTKRGRMEATGIFAKNKNYWVDIVDWDQPPIITKL